MGEPAEGSAGTLKNTSGPSHPLNRSRLLFGLGALFSLSPWASPPLALLIGIVLALSLRNPVPARTGRVAQLLLQCSVVGLGFGMPLGAVLAAGKGGLGYTAVGVCGTLLLGLLLGKWLRVDGPTSFLLSTGTGICGGSAIAAVGPAIGAAPESMSVALATVFLLNAVALYLFPFVGHLLDLTQHQFALWAALAIHDTSSVVGAAAGYGALALQEATVLKLARALWILPLALGAAFVSRRRVTPSSRMAPPIPWFIGLFVLAAVARSVSGPRVLPALDAVSHGARRTLVLTLFLIGTGLSRPTLRAVGVRPLVQGALLWVLVGGITLLAVMRLAGG